MQMEHINNSYDEYKMHGFPWNYSSGYSNLKLYGWPDFEEFIYIWIVLLILTALGNVLIVAVFVRENMRTTTNLILLFIAISDTLTGFATLPVYIYVFTRKTEEEVTLNESWCETIMIFKFYISKSFQTVSMWLTLFLGFQRFISVWFPFKAKSWFTNHRTCIAVAVITISAFVINCFHLKQRKADITYGSCYWSIENSCVETCTFLLTTLILVVILPSMILLVLTILIIIKLLNRNIPNETFSADQSRMRNHQNKRASIIVVCITIIFLISEIPYGFILTATVVYRTTASSLFLWMYNIYDLVLLISFHANVWVYITLNRRFRDHLKYMFRDGVHKLLPNRTMVPSTTMPMNRNQRNHFL